jgi:hypothetical protein
MFARNRSQEDLAHDPHLIFNVGRLVGACEMTSQYLALHGDENSKRMGAALESALQFFFEPDSRELKRMPVPSEAETAVRAATLGALEKSRHVETPSAG